MILGKLLLAAFLVTFNFYAARSLGKAETFGLAAWRFLLLLGALLALSFVLAQTPLALYAELAVTSFGLMIFVLLLTSTFMTPSYATLPPRLAPQARRWYALFVLVGIPSLGSFLQLL
ncbi:hypothetical protein, partial [Hymenobacter sp. B1770]|uniref:hypothetical protein n=1 Tax=Hymenobacter sp. B1770 TaxID=1718788 RepID=UPI003CF55C87